jgi:hypothetical protein
MKAIKTVLCRQVDNYRSQFVKEAGNAMVLLLFFYT